ncbi:Nucleosomal histone H3-Lys79 methylase [Coemansia javaensis]|uniref:Histone-lysine N-methyltransferase, H3 lysine-79 specific n=1 Tax=Coemansia javaensis TaxID=2761396 RepID=A0A9W8HIT0_9FUNG|nr:Nucleosomal histone H3-Lys79 methylase [Coemansia javaensis]
MDLFFGGVPRGAQARQTTNIHVEERGRKGGARSKPATPASPPPPPPPAGPREDRKRRRASGDEPAEMSPANRAIVNANRERVGSLPSSPRPRAATRRAPRGAGLAVRGSPPPQQQPRPQGGDALPPALAAPASEREIGRCFSVPAQTSGGSAAAVAAAAADAASRLGAESPPAAAADADGLAGIAASIVTSVDAVRQSEAHYEEYFRWDDGDDGDRCTAIELHLPAAGAAEAFSLLAPRAREREAEARDEYMPINDLIATVRAVATHLAACAEFRHAVYGDAEDGVVRQLERARNRRNGGDFVRAVRRFNRLLDDERAAGRVGIGSARDKDAGGAPPDLAVHIIEQIYNRIVAPTVDMLRQYKAFSNNVYGEILPTLVGEFIGRTGIGRESTFVDLGCGIGNVVLQVAAQTGCAAYGIEIMKVPVRLAERQAREFERRMRLYALGGRGSARIWHGDFCESADVQRLLPRADVVLVNNYVFDSRLNQNLMQLFLDLPEGARIISLKPFVTPDHKISARNIYSPESILTVRRYHYWSKCVSWTDSGGDYYVHTIDRSRMREFLARRGMA